MVSSTLELKRQSVKMGNFTDGRHGRREGRGGSDEEEEEEESEEKRSEEIAPVTWGVGARKRKSRDIRC